MPSLKDEVNELLGLLSDNSLAPQERGTVGEQCVEKIGRYIVEQLGGYYLSSLVLPQSPVLQSGSTTEIDSLIITPQRIFVVEVKTYKSTIKIKNDSSMTSSSFDHNFLLQNEMHARALYHLIHRYLPYGSDDYIVPVLIPVGVGGFTDDRPAKDKKLYPVVPLQLLPKLIAQNSVVKNKSLASYGLDMRAIYELCVKTSSENSIEDVIEGARKYATK